MTVESKIRKLIGNKGRITFADFMAVALYDPEDGYYRSSHRVSESGDFFTSPAAHPAFAAALCIQARCFWISMGCPRPFRVVEMGAGSGLLADDFVAYANRLDTEYASALKYSAIDRAASGQPAAISGDTGQGDPTASIRSVDCVISNELFDSFPAHRFVMKDGELQELFVVEKDGQLVSEPAKPSTQLIADRLAPLIGVLEDGYVGELCLEFSAWGNDIGRIMERGYVLSVDYGYPMSELYAPERNQGTLRCYYQHTLNANPFQHIGQQDISVHVDFTAVKEALDECGFEAVSFSTQGDFLDEMGLNVFNENLGRAGLPPRELEANRVGMREIARPDGLGAFKVAIHAKGLDPGCESQSPPPDAHLPLPLLDDDPRRVRLFEAAYPQAADFTATWDELLGG
jgi:SAM-dependent MidA family methyltransferase